MPDVYDAATIPQLVETYNEMAVVLGKPLLKNFKNKTIAIERCLKIRQMMNGQPSEKKGRSSRLDQSLKITILVDGNPRRGKGRERWEIMRQCRTIGEFVEKVGKVAIGDIKWDVSRGRIKIG